MLAAAAWPSFANTQPYLPSRPSPLSPRSANACPRPQFWAARAMSSSPRSRTSGSENESPAPFSKRDIKSNPVLKRARQTPDEARERRRDMFMKKVERGREEKQWQGRSEQILRSDYMAQRRRWEEERIREAQFFFDAEEYEQAEELPPMTPRLVAQPDDEQQVDEMAQMEEDELRALLELQEQEAAMRDEQDVVPTSPTRYGSDEEDFDDIFMELVSSQQDSRPTQLRQVYEPNQDAEMMDML